MAPANFVLTSKLPHKTRNNALDHLATSGRRSLKMAVALIVQFIQKLKKIVQFVGQMTVALDNGQIRKERVKIAKIIIGSRVIRNNAFQAFNAQQDSNY